MIIPFGPHNFLLHHSGALYWPEKSMLIVSDLHLEKGSHFARRGFFLPPYDSLETLIKLNRTIDSFSPEKILLLGDCFHDVHGPLRLQKKERDLFASLLHYSPLWIRGNHDGGYVPEGFGAHDVLSIGGITFRHEASSDTEYEISGHFHPKVDIVHKGANISRRCFIENGKKMILPAFGAYTGGLSVKDQAISGIMGESTRTYILGETKIYNFIG